MLRNLASSIITVLIVGGVALAWWFAAGQNLGVMAQDALNVVTWVGRRLEPLVGWVRGQTASAS